MRRLLVALLLLSWARPAGAAITVRGTVYADRDRDGRRAAGEEVLAGVRVAWEIDAFVTTDASGGFSLVAPGPGIVWARSPEGYEPGPAWGLAEAAAGGEVVVELGLRPAAATGPAAFVVGADTHLWAVTPADIARAMAQATDVEPAPHFLAVVGDLSAGTTIADAYSTWDAAVATLGAPFVAAPGNHDVEDGGVMYRERFGPPSWSFDAGGARFLVLDYLEPADALLAFVDEELASLDPARPAVVFHHGHLTDRMAADLAAAGVDHAFTGDWHDNRAIPRAGLVEYSTQPLAMGGLDYTPAGYRVASLEDGGLRVTHHTVVAAPVARIVHPAPGACVEPGAITVLAAIERGAAAAEADAYLDGEPGVRLEPAGGWIHAAELVVGAAGPHTVRLEARGGLGDPGLDEVSFCARSLGFPAGALPDWPQLQRSPLHHGAVAERPAPPLRIAWTRAVGGHVHGGSPVLGGERLFVPVVDLGDGAGGGLVALDARTGATAWEARDGSVRNAPAFGDGLVVFATSDGRVHARQAGSGAVAWTVDLGADAPEDVSWLHAAPTIVDGQVLIGVQHALTGIDLASGAVRWSVDLSPESTTQATTVSAASSGGVGVVVLERGLHGVLGFDVADGAELWRIPRPLSLAMKASPLIDGDRALLLSAEGAVTAVDLVSGAELWSADVDGGAGIDWPRAPFATPALADGRLFVATPGDGLTAVDASTGARLWAVETGAGVLSAAPYGVDSPGLLASPVVTGDLVWIGGLDGVLRALDAASGEQVWGVDLRAPVLSGPVPSGHAIFVATWDGTVRALVEADASTADGACDCLSPDPPPPEPRGRECGCDATPGAAAGAAGLLGLLPAALLARRRRGRSARPGDRRRCSAP